MKLVFNVLDSEESSEFRTELEVIQGEGAQEARNH